MSPPITERSQYPATEIVIIDYSGGDVVINPPIRGICFALAGALSIQTPDSPGGVVIPDGALAAGIIHPIVITKVIAAGTAAGGIIGFR